MWTENIVRVGLVLLSGVGGYAHLTAVPTVPFIEGSGNYPLQHLSSIVVDSRYSHSVDNDGQTLIPPTLGEFAKTFRDDLYSSLAIDLPLRYSPTPGHNVIFLTLKNNSGFHDAADRYTSEGYELNINSDGITISGASPLGTWWGTRSLIQVATLGKNVLPQGTAVDAPGWASRGLVLDVGRHYYPPEFITEMCSYLSFFKQNILHLHLSDNLWNDVNLYSREQSLNDVYAAFRPWSEAPEVAGLNKRYNESYTRSQFEAIQQKCAGRGVTLIPEIEAPGHALVISQWKPELGLNDLSMLNISYPETIPTMRSIWNTFLPWFQSKVVHIGADEYETPLVAEYTRFVNQLNRFIRQDSGKSVRIWGTFTPQEGANVSTDVSIQHWTMGADNPYFDYIQRGYEVLNSADAFYVVGKWSEGYPQALNKSRVFHGNPANGGPFAPNIFDFHNASNNPARDNPMILGQAAAFWNDNGPNATTVIETYYALRDALPALGDKQWGGNVTENEYDSIFDDLHAVIPGQNLDQTIPSKSDTILHYRFDAVDKGGSVVRDSSGNGYDGIVRGCRVANSSIYFADGCYLETPLASKGRNYTLSFWAKPTSNKPGALFTGPESNLMDGNGSISNITLISGGNPYSLNYSLPRDEWTHVKLVGRGDSTLLVVTNEMNESETMEFLTYFGALFLVWAPVSVVAPLARIGEGFTGLVRDIVLRASAA